MVEDDGELLRVHATGGEKEDVHRLSTFTNRARFFSRLNEHEIEVSRRSALQ
jgi:hypothetical protein